MKLKNKMGFIALMTTVSISLTMSNYLYASTNSLTLEQAKSIAQNKVPAGSTYIKSDDSHNKYELKFYNETKKEMYEIDVSKLTQKITKFETQLADNRGSSTVKLNEDAVKKIVTDEIPDAKNIYIKLDNDDNLKKYEIKFSTDKYTGSMEINPNTGAILERKFKFTDNIDINNTSTISTDRIKEIALAKVPNSIITDIDLERAGNRYTYEIEMYKDGYEYDLIIDAQTEEELYFNSYADSWDDKHKLHWNYEQYSDFNTQPESSQNITLEKAKEIALAKVPDAKIKKLELDIDDGRAIYEGEMYKGNYEYEFEIDASTGKIIKWEQEYDD